ncbi:crossover junction endonuclease EME1-like [Neocloeon triangulifer]|uniref:crossover junction endonuclease EME1-like n=1 Tax=Neocloeon triangulifer TaxID=2078957 RepID=UPI00286EFD48|nr:crossover junction endonuclease EME1-like [Neocloeon triangulifer]
MIEEEDDVVILSDDDDAPGPSGEENGKPISSSPNSLRKQHSDEDEDASDSSDDCLKDLWEEALREADGASNLSDDLSKSQDISQNAKKFHPLSDSDDDDDPKPSSSQSTAATQATKKPQKRRGKYTDEEKAAIEAEKKAKKREKEELRRKRPANCLKFIILEVDKDLVEIPTLKDVLIYTPLDQIRSEVKSRSVPFSICWHRELMPDKNDHCAREPTPYMLQLLEMTMMETLVRDGELLNHLKNILRTNKSIERFNVIVYGKKQYFAIQKKGGGRITKTQLEEATAECHLELGVSFTHAETAQEVSEWIYRYTKAVANEPFKKIKNSWQNNFRFHLASEKSNGIRDDFPNIWLKSLKKFKRMPLETCQAIAAIYPTPAALIEAYEQCADGTDPKLLLEDIMVRKGVGPVETERRVGPALSRRIHAVLTSSDPDLLMNDVD